ncbi:MAG: hypothetical protein V3T76_00100, partial [candidate division NC10 bacterium]
MLQCLQPCEVLKSIVRDRRAAQAQDAQSRQPDQIREEIVIYGSVSKVQRFEIRKIPQRDERLRVDGT